MAYVYKRGDKWYIGFRTNRGQWRAKACSARRKTEAKRLADELGFSHERQRFGLEPLPASDGGGTFGELLQWWLKAYSAKSASHDRNVSTIEKHFLAAEIAELRLREMTPAVVEVFLEQKAETLAPQTVNHLRRFVLTAFNRARRAGRWTGPNPAAEVSARRVPKRKADFLRADEVGAVLTATPPRWRALMATAVYTGLRKGELLGLQKTDVDLASRLIIVSRSYDRGTTKGGHAEAIPIAAELVPYLHAALQASPSGLVFPDADGRMLSRHTPLEEVLRRALKHAGIVEDWQHVCRKQGCGYAELAPDDQLRRCPTHGMKLWPKARVRRIRFHDLRHTTASLLMMAGVNPGAVQRILRHSDPRITTETYGHLQPDYLRSEIDRLRFGTAPANDLADLANASNRSLPSSANSRKFLTTFLQAPRSPRSAPSEGVDFREQLSELTSAGWTGLEPAASGVTGQRQRFRPIRVSLKPCDFRPHFAPSRDLLVAPESPHSAFGSTEGVRIFLLQRLRIDVCHAA
jgi:integrase